MLHFEPLVEELMMKIWTTFVEVCPIYGLRKAYGQLLNMAFPFIVISGQFKSHDLFMSFIGNHIGSTHSYPSMRAVPVNPARCAQCEGFG